MKHTSDWKYLPGTTASVLFLLLMIACNSGSHDDDHPGDRSFREKLTKIKFEGLQDSVYAGYHEVYEDREKRGRKIPIFMLVIPSRNDDSVLSPIFHLEGGPGSSATAYASYYEQFPEFTENRDVVIVDVRGTGKSGGLYCKSLRYDAADKSAAFDEMFPTAKVQDCLNELRGQADVTQYTTTNAITDIEEIRTWLGYGKINVISFSYGTRACQSYLRQYPSAIRSAIMFGPAPSFSHRPESFARDAQHTWELICDDCRRDPICSVKYPHLNDVFTQLLTRLDTLPLRYVHTNPHTGKEIVISINRGVFAELIRSGMYSVEGQRELPWLVYEVYKGNYEPLAKNAFRRAETNNEISDAFYLAVTCSEDVPFIDTTRVEENTSGTFLGDYRIRQELNACQYWPAYQLQPDYLTPVSTGVPVLIVTGDRDPVTPPRWGAAMATGFTNFKHITVKGLAHGEAGLSNLDCLSASFVKYFARPDSSFEMKCAEQMNPIPFR